MEKGDYIPGVFLMQASLGPHLFSHLPKPLDSLLCSQLVKVSEQFCTSKGKL